MNSSVIGEVHGCNAVAEMMMNLYMMKETIRNPY